MSQSEPSLRHYRFSQSDPEGFWKEEAWAVHWKEAFTQVCDDATPPFTKWFGGGRINLCHNALDRHLAERGEQTAIHFISSETGENRKVSYRELYREVNALAAAWKALGLTKGDGVIIYMPMVPEAVAAMLACARLGLIHSVVFAGFSASSLAARIDDTEARLVVTADAGKRGGKLVPLKRLADEALGLCQTRVAHVLVLDRGIDPSHSMAPGRDMDWDAMAGPHRGADIPCEWLESSEPSYLLYTSGTTAKPKGIQRDTGGFAVAIAASMKHIFGARPGETFFSTADLGWAVGHSYGVYGPLIHGMATVVYEGLPIRPDGAIWWKIAEETGATIMFAAPTAIRILKKEPPECLERHDLSRLRCLFLAGEPLDEATASWIREKLHHVEIIDNYWQTETGWPILSLTPGLGPVKAKAGSPGFACYGYDARIVDPLTGRELPHGDKGILALRPPLPPGCMTTVWKNDELFARNYFGQFTEEFLYSTFDYAVRDEAGYFTILGRSDDVINVAGHRLGSREIEEAICAHGKVAEAAAIGVADEIKGQVVHCFVTLKGDLAASDAAAHEQMRQEIEAVIVKALGAIARPARICLIKQLPKTRSGKIVRRAILAVAEGRVPEDLHIIEDPAVLEAIGESLKEQTA